MPLPARSSKSSLHIKLGRFLKSDTKSSTQRMAHISNDRNQYKSPNRVMNMNPSSSTFWMQRRDPTLFLFSWRIMRSD